MFVWKTGGGLEMTKCSWSRVKYSFADRLFCILCIFLFDLWISNFFNCGRSETFLFVFSMDFTEKSCRSKTQSIINSAKPVSSHHMPGNYNNFQTMTLITARAVIIFCDWYGRRYNCQRYF